MSQPPLFVKLSDSERSRSVLLNPHGEIDADIAGRWFCEVFAADGIKATRELELPFGVSAKELYARADEFCQVARTGRKVAAHESFWSTKYQILDLRDVRVQVWGMFDDLTAPSELGFAELSIEDFGTLRADWPGRAFIGLSAPAGACITSILPGESFRVAGVATPEGTMPTIEIMSRWDLSTAYWSFLRNNQAEAAEAVARQILEFVECSADPDVSSDADLAAAAHATLRFPWLRELEVSLGGVLSSRTGRLIDLMALDWARSFDRDPAENSVFGERLSHLLAWLDEEPPIYTETVSVLFDRLPTAVDVREEMQCEPDEAAREAVRRLRKLADATLSGRERLTYEGVAPLRPERRPSTRYEAQKESTPLRSSPMSW